MKKITAFLEDFDFSKILPKIGSLMKDIRFWINFIMIAAPLAVLGFGLWYFFLPVKEANHKLGFRTYFGMGSPEAWKFTQKLTGLVWMSLGGAMTVVSLILVLMYRKKDIMALANQSLIWLLVYGILMIVSYIAVSVVAAVRYDAEGKLRNFKKTP